MDRVDALNEFYNSLRNAAFGRGVVPLVPLELAATIDATIAAWRARRATAIAAPWPTDEFAQWTSRANALRATIEAAGVKVPGAFTPPPSVLERVEHVAELTGVGLAVVAVLVLALEWRRHK